jgi:hypothetical protein
MVPESWNRARTPHTPQRLGFMSRENPEDFDTMYAKENRRPVQSSSSTLKTSAFARPYLLLLNLVSGIYLNKQTG